MMSWKLAIQQGQAHRSTKEHGAGEGLEERSQEISYGSICGNEKRGNWWVYGKPHINRKRRLHFPHVMRLQDNLMGELPRKR